MTIAPPRVTRAQAFQRKLGRLPQLPQHLVHAARGDVRRLNADLWELLRSPGIDHELESGIVQEGTGSPFRDGVVFGEDDDLGPFSYLRNHSWDECFGYTTRETIVDPRFGWLIATPFNLVPRAMTRSHAGVPLPSFPRYLRARRGGFRRVDSTVLSLRDPVEGNYYHTMHDLLGGKLRVAIDNGVGVDVPVVVGREVAAIPWFERVLQRSENLGGRQIIVQADEHIRCERAVVVRPPHFSRSNLEFLRDLVRAPDSDPADRRRIFLVRRSSAGRSVVNAAEVEDVAKRYGFELVDTDELTFDQEIETFSQARYVVGVHGSALVNMIWRRNAELSVLEIHPSTFKKPWGCYFYFIHALGFQHYVYDDSAGLGDSTWSTVEEWRSERKSDPFALDADRLAALIEVMLEEGGD